MTSGAFARVLKEQNYLSTIKNGNKVYLIKITKMLAERLNID